MVCAAVRSDLSSSSLVTWPLGLSCGFIPTSEGMHVLFSLESVPEVARAHEPVRQEGAEEAIGVSRLPREEGAGVTIGMHKPFRWPLGQVSSPGGRM